MTYTAIILAAAKAAKISGELLLAICTQESNLTNIVVYHDGDSPSYGVCQIKFGTAQMLGFKGRPKDLVDVGTNAKWAAKYLKYQENRYSTTDWCALSAAYNAGSFNESKKFPGKPRNLLYVRKVQTKLAVHLQERLSCEKVELE